MANIHVPRTFIPDLHRTFIMRFVAFSSSTFIALSSTTFVALSSLNTSAPPRTTQRAGLTVQSTPSPAAG